MIDFWKYDPLKDLWSQLNDFPNLVYAFDIHGVQIGDKGYIAVEEYENQYIISLWEYNPEADNWLQLPNVPIPSPQSNLSVVFSSNNFVYFGFDNSGVREFRKYDIYNQTFSRICDNFGKPVYPKGVKINGKTYLTSSDQKFYLFKPNW